MILLFCTARPEEKKFDGDQREKTDEPALVGKLKMQERHAKLTIPFRQPMIMFPDQSIEEKDNQSEYDKKNQCKPRATKRKQKIDEPIRPQANHRNKKGEWRAKRLQSSYAGDAIARAVEEA